MKKVFTLILLFAISLSYAFIYKSDSSAANSIVLQFVTHNGYGNNLYIDNVTVGPKYDRDVKVTSFINLPSDTIYTPQSRRLILDNLQILVTNVGKLAVDSIKVHLDIPEIGYYWYFNIPLAQNEIKLLSFPEAVFAHNRTYHPILYVSDSADKNHSNDTIRQSFGYYLGAPKKVLFEEFTSATSLSASINNPSLNNFVNSKFDSIVAINYHLGFPAPGNDSLYLADTIQNKEKADYYNIVAVPKLIFNGAYFSKFPFSTENLKSSFDTLKNIGSPISMSVTDARLAGDTISSNITINVLAPVMAGDYYLRVNAIERRVSYVNPPGTNGESVFYDVFREAVPNTQGISIPTAIGTYNYNVKYKRNPVWVDSMVYTAAFVQNDRTFEVLNCAKSRSGVYEKLKHYNLTDALPDFKAGKFKQSQYGKFGSKQFTKHSGRSILDTTATDFYLEQFESQGLPYDWTLAHQSELFTFQNVYNSGINGPSFPGNGCLKMNFYDNTDIGQMDTLYSPIIYGVTSQDTIRFDYAYAGYLYNEGDSLYINISTDGGLTFPRNIFHRGGIGLATASSSTVAFVPALRTEWRTISQSLQGIILDRYSVPVANEFTLYQNFPNPFNPSTKISFNLPAESKALLIIYDISGREVKQLVNEILAAGLHEVNFNGESLSSGIYFYKLITPGFTQSKKMVLIK
ncbi:MAG: T9SS type A sorting domain-containing protein [Bacteroidetes bacterium]|nr:T9SS type A sorting domain-containing protein [Bacteroidota bacterium]